MKTKLTAEQKAELKKENRAWADMIRRMKRKGALIIETKKPA